jgi:hypothetical protein
LGQNTAANDGKDLCGGKTVAGEETILGRPVVELAAAGREKAGDGMATQAEQGAQREGFGAVGEALLREGGSALVEELVEGGEDADRVFFREEAGG